MEDSSMFVEPPEEILPPHVLAHRKAIRRLHSSNNLKMRKNQLIKYAFKTVSGTKAPPSFEPIFREIVRRSQVDKNLQYKKAMRYCILKDDWIEHNITEITDCANENSTRSMSDRTRRRMMKLMEELGFIEVDIINLPGDRQQWVKRVRYRLCPVRILDLLEEAVKEHVVKSKNDDTGGNDSPSDKSDRVSLSSQEAGVSEPAIPDSEKCKISKFKQTPETGVVEVRLNHYDYKVVQQLYTVFPASQWRVKHYNAIKRLTRLPDCKLSIQEVKYWLGLRDGSHSLPETPADPIQFQCDLDQFCRYWPAIVKYIDRHRYSTDDESIDLDLQAVTKPEESINDILRESFRRFTHTMRLSKGRKFADRIRGAWGIEESGFDNEAVVARFLWMERFGQWWPEMVSTYGQKLKEIISQAPALYFGLKKLGYKVDQWIQVNAVKLQIAYEKQYTDVLIRQSLSEMYR